MKTRIIGAAGAAVLLLTTAALHPTPTAADGPVAASAVKDVLPEMTESESRRLQAAMDEQSRFQLTLANLLSRATATSASATSNLK